jgi:hypothetical protein
MEFYKRKINGEITYKPLTKTRDTEAQVLTFMFIWFPHHLVFGLFTLAQTF